MLSKKKYIYFIECAWLLLLLVYTSMIYLNHELAFFNSDWVMFPNFFKDLFTNSGHYKDWVISPAPHFFPDMFIFFPIFFLVKDIYFQFLIVAWLMIILSYLSIKFIYSQFFPKQATIFALSATCSLFLLALNKYYPYVLAFIPAVHIGEFISGLFLVGIQIKLINNNNLSYKTTIFMLISLLISFSASLSDLLFLVQFSCPIFVTYSFLYVKKRINFKLGVVFSCSIMAVAILGGFLTKYFVPKDILFNYLQHPSVLDITYKKTIIQLITVIKIIKNINNFGIQSIMGIFYASVFSILILNNTHLKKKLNIYIDTKITFILVFIFASLLTNIISFCLSAEGSVLDRYFINFYYFPFLFFFLPLYSFKYYPFVYKTVTYLSFILFLYILASTYILLHKPQFKMKMSYYPPDIHCIDEAVRGYGDNGIAQYWDANYITSLSKENLQLVSVNPDLTPFYWSINVKKFENLFSFIVLDSGKITSLDKNAIYAKYGTPKKEVTCYTRKVLIYPKDSIKISSKFVSN